MKRLTTLLVFMFLTMIMHAQSGDIMRDNRKAYVVIAVMLAILAGLVLYLVRLDRKISKLEKNK